MFASISRSWRFATTSYGILWRNKSLLILPVLATLAAGVVVMSFLAPLWLSGTLEQWIGLVDDHQELSTGQKVAMGVIGFLFYFVVPTIVVDGVGPFAALKNSLSVLKAQWGKALVGNMSLGLLGFLILLPVYLLASGLVWLGIWSGDVAVAVPSIAAAVMLGVFGAAVSSAADMVFRSLLFNFATGRTLPPEIDAEDLKLAFKSK